MTKRLIVYDLDGTLVDTREDIAQSANHMLGRMGLAPLSVQEISGFVGDGVVSLVQGCLRSQDPQRVEEGVRIYRAYYGSHFLDRSRLYPGARELLDHFNEKKQAVITNKPNPFSLDILKGLGVAGYFAEVIAGSVDYPAKPHPAALLAVMARSGAEPPQTLLIGDSPIDIELGRGAGVETVALTHGFGRRQEIEAAAPAAIVADFKEMLQLAKERGW
ncbi:MAG: HAD-IA family hydrolase [Candidatus Omnitrophica bacterium]|nr:HAD-IA family hydrolase [Candidatus Omnitrophota bacterium]